MTEQPWKFATRCVHAEEQADALGSPHTPLYDTTTFRFPDTQALCEVAEGRRDGYFYSRYGSNPSIRSLEARLASLEEAAGDRFRLFALAVSLGGVESLVSQPALTSHRNLGPATRAARGIGDNLLRLSIGLESADDLLANLDQALAIL